MKFVGCILIGIIVTGMTAWCAGAIYYSPLPGASLRALFAGVFVVATALAILLLPQRRRTLLGFFAAFGLLVALQLQIPADKEKFLRTVVPEWDRKAAERQSKMNVSLQ